MLKKFETLDSLESYLASIGYLGIFSTIHDIVRKELTKRQKAEEVLLEWWNEEKDIVPQLNSYRVSYYLMFNLKKEILERNK